MKAQDTEVLAFVGIQPGEALRKARELNGWSQADVALKLKLTAQALGYLESGAYAQLPGNTFARGYIRTYAKLLGVDQEPLVAAFDQITGSSASGSSVHALGRIDEPVRAGHGMLRAVCLVVLAALLLSSYFWWQGKSQSHVTDNPVTDAQVHIEVEGADGTTQIHPLDEPEDQAVLAAQEGVDVLLPEAPAEQEPPVLTTQAQPLSVPAPETVAVAVAVAAPAPTLPSTAAVPTLLAPVAAPIPVQETEPATGVQTEAAVSQADTSPTPSAAVGEGLVTIQFSANCWTQLTDANGKILVSALKRKGETLALAGKAPLELRLGFASGATVSYNGQMIDVAPYVSGETARMKLGL
jgi:cytoskeleton protein RodZ